MLDFPHFGHKFVSVDLLLFAEFILHWLRCGSGQVVSALFRSVENGYIKYLANETYRRIAHRRKTF